MLTGNSSDNRKTVLNGVTVNIYHRTGQGPGSEVSCLDASIYKEIHSHILVALFDG